MRAHKPAWTVSVAVMPGEERCVELDRLDYALWKERTPRWPYDEHVEAWKARIEWPSSFYDEVKSYMALESYAEYANQKLWGERRDRLIDIVRQTFGVSAAELGPIPCGDE